jgi:hypothetical protein
MQAKHVVAQHAEHAQRTKRWNVPVHAVEHVLNKLGVALEKMLSLCCFLCWLAAARVR